MISPGRWVIANFNPRSHEGSDLCQRTRPTVAIRISIHAPTKGATCGGTYSRTTTISIHAPTKGATCCRHPYRHQCKYFNPRSHEGSDFLLFLWHLGQKPFQSTLPRRERPPRLATCRHPYQVFQSTLPRRERPGVYTIVAVARFQSTLPRRERLAAQILGIDLPISIHAPTKGATILNGRHDADRWISIHAPTKGATRIFIFPRLSYSYFNPRSHEGSDLESRYHPCFSIFQSTLPRRERLKQVSEPADGRAISIHAPTKGATSGISALEISTTISIHAPTKGATCILYLFHFFCRISIHAPTKGATPCVHMLPRHQIDFNPRSHEGSDLRCWRHAHHCQISIHAPTKGATCGGTYSRTTTISIHAPTKGATGINNYINLVFRFQSTLPRRERHHEDIKTTMRYVFQSTLPRRERRHTHRQCIL